MLAQFRLTFLVGRLLVILLKFWHRFGSSVMTHCQANSLILTDLSQKLLRGHLAMIDLLELTRFLLESERDGNEGTFLPLGES